MKLTDVIGVFFHFEVRHFYFCQLSMLVLPH